MLEEAIVARITATRRRTPTGRSVLVAVTGIDGSGKGYVAARTVRRLGALGLRAVALNVDGWLNLPSVRFDASNPAEHFYRNAIRFDEMFERLVLPLRDGRSVRVEADLAEETARAFQRHTYAFEDVDVIVLEGIYLLKRALRRHYDLSAWIDCTFETALERAVDRAQEGLGRADTIRAYETIYFPAQRIHFARDEPRARADLVVRNDPRLDDSRPSRAPRVGG
ncbi:MAG TPA: uridine kinase [Vicinamibacteria bacterium]|nr:uridine kinase [Vicinamibacteria bacterium]